MEELREVIQHAASNRATLIIAYSGGSRPGAPRPLVILGLKDGDIEAVEHPSRIKKHYKLEKVLWVKRNEAEEPIYNTTPAPQQLHFNSLTELAESFEPKIVASGRWFEVTESAFRVGDFFKNGKPKKNAIAAIIYQPPAETEEVFDGELGDFITQKKEITGRERPWGVFGPGTSKSFGKFGSAADAFCSELQTMLGE